MSEEEQIIGRTLGEAAIPAAMGASMGAGILPRQGSGAALSRLRELEAQRQAKPDLDPRKQQPIDQPVQYLDESETLNVRESGDTAFRQDLGEPIQVPPEQRSRIIGEDLVKEGEQINPPEKAIPPARSSVDYVAPD